MNVLSRTVSRGILKSISQDGPFLMLIICLLFVVNIGISTNLPKITYPQIVWEINPRYPFEFENSEPFFWLLDNEFSFILTNTKKELVNTKLEFRLKSPPECPQNTRLEISSVGSATSVQLIRSLETLISYNLKLASFKRTLVAVKISSLSCALSSTDQREAFARIADIRVS